MNNKIIAEAEYADIILALLNAPYCISSVIKLVFMAFCIKNENNLKEYSKRTRDFVDTLIGNISIKLNSHPEELSTIFEIIDKLNQNKLVCTEDDHISIIKPLSFSVENRFLNYCLTKTPNPIVEINKLDPKAFMEEVLRYV